ncbi:MAG: hypothetical protein HQL82_12605 [Magnetococcales bacterium]|nr:hypothetical protein [Magnetococcales bacterium]
MNGESWRDYQMRYRKQLRKDVEDAFAEVTERERQQEAEDPSGFLETGRRSREPWQRPGLEPSQRAEDFSPEARTRAAIIEPMGQPKSEDPEWTDYHAMVKGYEKAHLQSIFKRIRLADSWSPQGWSGDGDSSRQPFQVAESRDFSRPGAARISDGDDIGLKSLQITEPREFSPLGVARTGDSDGISLKPFQIADASLSPDPRRVTDSGNPLLLRQAGNPGATRPTAVAESGNEEQKFVPIDGRKRQHWQEAVERVNALKKERPTSKSTGEPSVPAQLAALGMASSSWRSSKEIPGLEGQIVLNMEETRDNPSLHWWKKIQDDGDWNFKNTDNKEYLKWGPEVTLEDRERAGNRNFGATCAALGLGKSLCLRGSGAYQGYSNFTNSFRAAKSSTSDAWNQLINPSDNSKGLMERVGESLSKVGKAVGQVHIYRDQEESGDQAKPGRQNGHDNVSRVNQGRPWDLDPNSCMGEPADDCAAVDDGYTFAREYMDRYWKK